MSSSFSHIFIPMAILIMFSDKLKIDKKKIMTLSFISVLPDIDIFLLHRALFHNIFMIVIVLILIYFLIRDIEVFGITSFYLISHLILDIFNGGIFLLFPIYDGVFFSHIDLLFKDGIIMPTFNYGISDKIVSTTAEGVMSSENIGTTILLIIFMMLTIFKEKK